MESAGSCTPGPSGVSGHVQPSQAFWFNSGFMVTGWLGILKPIIGQSPEGCHGPSSSAEPLQGHKEKRQQEGPHRRLLGGYRGGHLPRPVRSREGGREEGALRLRSGREEPPPNRDQISLGAAPLPDPCSEVRGYRSVNVMGAVVLLFRRTLFSPWVPPTPAQPRHSPQQDSKPGHLHKGQEHKLKVAQQGPVQGTG